MASTKSLHEQPDDVLFTLFTHLTTESFIHLTLTCRRIFEAARIYSEASLHHLERLPGIKIGLDDKVSLSPADLFLLVRLRASQNLIGAAMRADCKITNIRPLELRPSASCFSVMSDTFNGSLVMQKSLTVRHCTTDCQLLKEKFGSPYGYGRADIIQVVHTKTSISTLYAWRPDKVDRINSGPINQSLLEVGDGTTDASTAPSLSNDDVGDAPQYHLFHHDVYSRDRPRYFFQIRFPYEDWRDSSRGYPNVGEDFEPIHLAVHSRRKCATVWRAVDRSEGLRQNQSPTVVVVYRADDVPKGPADHCSATILLPLPKPNRPRVWHQSSRGRLWRPRSDYSADNSEFFSAFQTRATAFYGNGRYLKLFEPGGILPYGMLLNEIDPTFHPGHLNLASFNRATNCGLRFRLDTVFHSFHQYRTTRDTQTGDSSPCCTFGCLSLASLTEGGSSTQQSHYRAGDTLFIMQSGEPSCAAADCDHEMIKNGETCIARSPYNTRIVARLRGLGKHWTPTNLVGLDTLCISQRGTRIAIACWDKILVWTLNPSVLADTWVAWDDNESVLGSEDDGGNDDGDANGDASGNDSNASSTSQDDFLPNGAPLNPYGPYMVPAGPSETSSIESGFIPVSSRAMVKTLRYYELTEDPELGEIVELWPEVLQLPKGMVARKMMWPLPSSRAFAQVYEDSDEDSMRASDTDEDFCDDSEEGQQDDEESEDMYGSASSISSDCQPRCTGTTLGDGDLLVTQEQRHLENTLHKYMENSLRIDANEEVDPAPRTTSNDTMDLDHDPSENDDEATDDPNFPSTQPSNDATATDKGKTREVVPSLPMDKDEENLPPDALSSPPNTKRPTRKRRRRGEDKLVVMTDRGLLAYDLGPRANGRRTTVDLDVGEDEDEQV